MTSMAVDGETLWIGTEDKGVWRFDAQAPTGKNWTQFTTKDGLGDDNAYAITVDVLGRVWVGHLNHGISVFNGQRWNNYSIEDGFPGARIYDIAVSPRDGDVWIATNVGLSRYKTQSDKWQHFSFDIQINCLAFDAIGNLYAGTQCEGLRIASANDDYQSWRAVLASEISVEKPAGEGLPCNLINDVLVSKDGFTIYAATTCGLARSRDEGHNWEFIRGRDWEAKKKGRLRPVKSSPSPEKVPDNLLSEDYITCLGEDEAGQLWIGYRKKGYEVRDASTLKTVAAPILRKNQQSAFVTTLLPHFGQVALLGFYGDGLGQSEFALEPVHTVMPRPLNSRLAPLPSPEASPSIAELDDWIKRAQALPTIEALPRFLGEDWQTRGDWVGRYGRQRGVLCAVNSPFDHDFARGLNYQTVIGQIGPQHAGGDSLRYWVQWLKSDDPRVLYDPILGYRRQAEWDDHGEAYPATTEGPDLWVMMQIPAGAHKLSFYFFNKDGHTGENRYRDYLLELRTVNETLPDWPEDPPAGPNHDKEFVGRFDAFWKTWWQKIARAEEQPVLARSRVRDFWDGVYKSFQVQGPGKFWLKVARNGSHNTILSSVMIDKLSGPPDSFEQKPMSWMGGVPDNPPDPDMPEPPDPHLLDKILAGQNVGSGASKLNAEEEKTIISARALWTALESENALNNPNWQRQGRLTAYRAVAAIAKTRSTVLVEGRALKLPVLLARWRWQMNLWTNADREDFRQRMAFAYKRLLELNPQMRGEF